MKILLLGLLCAPAFAALNPQMVKESALKYHPTVLSALDNMKASFEAARGARGVFDTKLIGDHFRVASGMWARTFSDIKLEKSLPVANSKVYAGYSYGFNGNFPPQFSTLSTNSGGTPHVGLSTSLWRHRSLDPNRATLRHAKWDATISKGENDLTQWEMGRLSQMSYWEWVTAKKVKEVFENLLKNGESRNEFLVSRSKRGDAARIVVSENEQYIANRKAALMAASERVLRAEYALSLFLRNEKGDPILPAENEEYQDYPEDLSKLLSEQKLDLDIQEIVGRRPDLVNLNVQFEKMDVDLQLAEHDLKPKLDLWGDYTRNIGNDDPSNPPHVLSVGVKIEIPIERNLGLGNISAAKGRKLAKMRERDLGFETYRNEVMAARRSLALQLGQVEQSGIELARARELVVAEQYKFKTGGGNLFLVNLREEAAANAEASFHESRFAFISTLLSYQALVSVSEKGESL